MNDHDIPEKAPQSGATRRAWLILCVILLAGLALRGGYLRELVRSPGFDLPILDPGFHDYWARALVTGDWTPPKGADDPLIATTPYLRPPGYPYFLAGIYKVFGLGYLAPRLVQMGLGLVNCTLIFLLTARWFSRAAGLVAAALAATYWIFIYFEGTFHEPALLSFLLLAAVNVLSMWVRRRCWRYPVIAGLLLGIAALVRPNMLLIVPAAVAWMWWIARRRGERRIAYLQGAVGLIGAVIIAISPATIRNYRVAGDFVLISANGGVNFFIGNQQGADGLLLLDIPGAGRFDTCYDYPRIVREVEKEEGRSLKYSEVSNHFAKKAWRFIREQPGRFAVLTLRRALRFWGPPEISHNEIIDCDREFSPVLSRIPGNFPLVLSLCWLGLVRLISDHRSSRRTGPAAAPDATRRTEVAVLLVGVIAAFFLSYLFFFNTALYRTSLIPFLLVFGAFGVWRTGLDLRQGKGRQALTWVAAWVVLMLVAMTSVVPYDSPGPAAWHCNRAKLYGFKGQIEQATTEAEAALRLEPDNIEAHALMADYMGRQRRFDLAREHARRVEELRRIQRSPAGPGPGR